MKEDFSPEERLLRLIKTKRKSTSKSKKKEETAKIDVEVGTGEKEESPLLAKKVSQREKVAISKRPRLSQYTPQLYIIIGAFLVLLVVIFAFGALNNSGREELHSLEKMVAALSESNDYRPSLLTEEAPAKDTPAPKDASPQRGSSFEEYEKMLRDKSIFAPPAKEDRGDGLPAGPSLRELVSELRLVGIMPGDEPQVIIEDKKSGQTLFLNKGDQIDGLEIRDISDGKVVLSDGDETITLSL